MFRFVLFAAICSAAVLAAAGQDLSTAEQTRLKGTAKQFVEQLAETHDFTPLIRPFFIADFEPIAVPEIDFVPDDLFPKLSAAERRRVFLSFWNYMYVRVVITQSKPENLECYDESETCKAKDREVLLRVLSSATVDRIISRENAPEDKLPLSKGELFKDVELLEAVFNEAYPVLKVKRFEKTKEFRYWSNLFEKNPHLAYLIKVGVAEKGYVDSKGRVLVKKGEKTYGVETPLLMRIDFVKRGKQFKIFNLGAGDGD